MKVKPTTSTKKQVKLSRSFGTIRRGIWYPSEKFVVEAHMLMIEQFGGFTGFEVGLQPFKYLLEEMKKVKDLYRKAALLLQGLVCCRIFQDGNHRTAYEVTKTFLEMNGVEMREKNLEKSIKFIKDVRCYDINEIEAWLKYGSEGSSKDST